MVSEQRLENLQDKPDILPKDKKIKTNADRREYFRNYYQKNRAVYIEKIKKKHRETYIPKPSKPQSIYQEIKEEFFIEKVKKNRKQVGYLDIAPGWVKIPSKYWTCYISKGKKTRIKVPFLVEDSEDLKNISGFYEDKKILDYQMGNPLGKSETLKGAGDYFLKKRTFTNYKEIADLLKKDFGIISMNADSERERERERESKIEKNENLKS
ncbi:MAG: hypothetical protein MRERV_3c122 [Mycoplasmataceae bacterium RV_VA103A]|nr:MAG: hypothetical protein MRERV_3c122 [Mycoplasmataceae bacterium RV_VA103A]